MMQSDRLPKQVAFIREIDKLKYIRRKTKLFNSDRNENDAEHSWHLAMMAIILAEHANTSVNILKVLKMVLIHDIVEIDAGDTFLFDTVKNHVNTEEELAAAQRIFGMLPTDQALDLLQIWKEFEDGITAEAQFARTLDRFEPVLQNISNNGGTWAEYSIRHEKVLEKTRIMERGSFVIWEYSEARIQESVDKGILEV
ncbi:HD domain-containing protein [Sinomicrobium sp. M5D2P17]